MDDYSTLEFLKLAIYYVSYFFFPAAAVSIWLLARASGRLRFLAGFFLAVICLFAYARFVEPRILVSQTHDVSLERCGGSARIAVFSDTHQGLFGHAMPIDRIARAVQSAEADAVMIPGDFVYFLAANRFDETFRALQSIDAPIFAVLGNHDIGIPGPDVTRELSLALEAIGVHVIDDDIGSFRANGQEFEVVGLSDVWGGDQKRGLLKKTTSVPRFVLTHNPDTILELSSEANLDLMIAGHTHGGQIYIPGITCRLVAFACRVTRHGLAQTVNGPVFVTTGTGMVGLPMRFNVPPKIDILTVRMNKCR